MIIHPGYNISHFRCFLKMAPNGMGIKLTVNFKEDDQYFVALSQSVIPILLSIIPDDEEELVIPPKTIHDTVFFRRIGNRLFIYKYIDYPAFFVVLIVFIIFFLLPLFAGSYYYLLLLLIPIFMLMRRSSVIIDRERRSVFTSFWWGMVKRHFSYTDIKTLGVAIHNTRGGFLGGSTIFALNNNGSPSLIIKKMLMEERIPRLLQEIEVLTKHSGK